MTYKDINTIDDTIVDEKAIYESLKNIIFTRLGELPGLPEFGCSIQDFLFDNLNFEEKMTIVTELEYLIERWETRIKLKEVDVEMDDDYNRLLIKIEYTLNLDKHNDFTSKFVTFKVQQ